MKERTISVGEARSNLAFLLKEVEKGTRIQLTRYNRTIAGLVPHKDLVSLRDSERPRSRRARRSEDV